MITTTPSYKQKSQKLASMILRYYSLPCAGELVIESDLPVGKGLASSFADLVARQRGQSLLTARSALPQTTTNSVQASFQFS